VISLYERDKMNLSGFLTAKYPFERAAEAYEQIRMNPQAHMKIGLTYED
jgi:threonine dehydrogenase-like Zn-dependent dehydrogenase